MNNNIYHIVIRGVNDSLIFKNDQDRFRAIFSMYEFNNSKSVEIREQKMKRRRFKMHGGRASVHERRDLIVDILVFCLMPNHIHFLLRQSKDGGIVKFMRKFGSGYAGYFNKKYKRKGYVFQGRFKSVDIQSDKQLRVVFSYIHTNPVSLIEPGWKEKGIGNLGKTIKFLENYNWSSYGDYLGKDNFPSITDRQFLLEVMQGADGCKSFVDDWLKYKKSLKNNYKINIK